MSTAVASSVALDSKKQEPLRVMVVDDSVVLGSGRDENEINGITKGRTAEVANVIEAARDAAADQPVRRARPRPRDDESRA